MRVKVLFKFLAAFTGIAALFFAGSALAADPSQGIALSDITTNVGKTVGQLARILTDVALIAGISFILASFFKFHQHKLNPTQVPISQGVTLLLIGAALTVFVLLLPTAKTAVFGDKAKMSQIGGDDMASLIGDKDK